MIQIKTIHIYFTENDDQLAMISQKYNTGSQYDNHAYQFVFSRPEPYKDDNLILLFNDGDQDFAPVNIWQENSFSIPNALTQTNLLRIQSAFERDGVILIHSNILLFHLQPSLFGGGSPIEDWPDPLKQLASKAFCTVAYESGDLSFYNESGDSMQQLNIWEDAQVGDVQTMTLPSGSAANVEVIPNKKAFDFHFSIPCGAKGDKRDKGDKGDKGNQGEPGKDANLDGHNDDASAHSVAMAKKADKNGSLQTKLNAEKYNGWKLFSNIAEIGITPGEETMAQVIEAMPDKSKLWYRKDTDSPAGEYPHTSGMLEITRFSKHRNAFSLTAKKAQTTATQWIGCYNEGHSPQFSGWKELSTVERGTWTPIIKAGSQELTATISRATYVKTTGKCKISLNCSNVSEITNTGSITILGLPVSASGAAACPVYTDASMPIFARASGSGLILYKNGNTKVTGADGTFSGVTFSVEYEIA